MKKIIYAAIAICALATSCQRELTAPEDSVLTFTAEVEDPTRSTIEGTAFRWTEDDKFGLYLIQKVSPSYNALCTVATLSADGKKATLKSSESLSIDMSGERTVVAYYPYKSSFTESTTDLFVNVPQIQKQTDAKASHLAKYDFMVSKPVSYAAGESVSLKFRHLMAKVDLVFINEHSQDLTVTDITLSSAEGKKVFGTSASLELLSEAASLKVSDETKVDHLGLTVSGDWTAVKSEESLTASLMMMPVDLESENLKITVNTREKGEFVYEKAGLDFLPQNRYKVVLSAREKDLVVSTDTLIFKATQDTAAFKISAVNGAMDITVESDEDWLTFSQDSLSLYEGQSSTIIAKMDRTNLPNGESTARVRIKAGEIEKKIDVIAYTERGIVLNTESLVFKETQDTAAFKITAVNDTQDVVLTSSVSWLNLSEDSLTINSGKTADIIVTVNREGLKNGKSTGKITVKAGEVEKKLWVTVYATGQMEIISPFENLEVEFVSCKIVDGECVLAFDLTNTMSSNRSFGIDASLYRDDDNYSYVYDELGNQLYIQYIGDGSSYYTYKSVTMNSGQTYHYMAYVMEDEIAKNVGMLVNATISIYFDGRYGNIVFKNIPIEGREKGQKPDAIDLDFEAEEVFDEFDFEIYKTVFSGEDLTVYCRIHNASDYDCFYGWNYGRMFIYDAAGNGYSISGDSIGNKNAGYWTPVPSNTWCNCKFTINGLRDRPSAVDYVSIALKRAIIFSRYSDCRYNIGETEYATLTFRDLPCGTSVNPEPELQDPTTTAGEYSSLPAGVEMEMTGASVYDDKLTVSYRLLNKSDYLRKIALSVSEGLGYAVDDRNNYYNFTSHSLSCNTDWAYLVPGRYCNGSFTIKGFSSDASTLKYLSIKSKTYMEYSDDYTDGRIVVKDIAVEKRSASTKPLATQTTTADSVWCDFPDVFSFTPISCKTSATSTSTVLRVKNISDSPRCLELPSGDSYLYDDCGASYKITGRTLGGEKNYTKVMVPVGYEFDICLTSQAMSESSNKIASGYTSIYVYNQDLGNQQSGKLFFKNIKIEGRSGENHLAEPTTTAGSIKSWNSAVEMNVVSCKMEGDDAVLNLRIRNTTGAVQNLSIDGYSDNYTLNRTYAFDARGNKYSISGIRLGNADLTSCDLLPDTWCNLSMKINGINKDTGLIKYLNIWSNTFNSQMEINDIKIEDREEKDVVWREPETTVGSVESPYSNTGFTFLSAKVNENGTLSVDYILWNKNATYTYYTSYTSDRDYTYYYTDFSGSYAVDDQGNYYRISGSTLGGWWSSKNITIQMPPQMGCYCSLNIDGFSEKASSLKYLSLAFGSLTSANRLKVKDLAIQGRTATDFPEQIDTCSSITSGNSSLDAEFLSCTIGEDGYWRVKVKLMNNSTYTLKQIEYRSSAHIYSVEGKSYSLDHPIFGNFDSYEDITLQPQIPVIVEFKSSNPVTDSPVFSKFTWDYYLQTGYSGNTENGTLTITNLQIHGR